MRIIDILKNHPFAVSSYMFFLAFCILQLKTAYNHRQALHEANNAARLVVGEGMMYGYLLLIVITCVYMVVVSTFAKLFPEDRAF